MNQLKATYSEGILEAGCDEAGRGCLAGPVFAAAVILPPDFRSENLNDSKKLSESHRATVRKEILEQAIAWAVAFCTPQEIDKFNILKSSFLAMHRALDKLSVHPGLILVDGNRFLPYRDIRHVCIVGGDALYQSIAAASVLAKTARDDYMHELAASYPDYQWEKNKGYPTSEHRRAIEQHGLSPHHRRSFRQIDTQLRLNLPA